MGTEDFKRGVVSILLVLGLVFSMISVAPLASPGDWVNDPEPGGTTIDVIAGQNFIIRHVLEWDEPEDGAYTITLGWYNYENKPEENLTFVSAEAYFTTGANVGESIRADATLSSAPSGTDTKWALEVSCPAVDKDPRNGEFNVDIWMGAYGVGGVPHIPGDHVIPWMLGGVIVTEAYPQSWPRNPITIRVLPPLPGSISISPNYQSGLAGTTLEYTVTVTNVGESEDNFDLTVIDSENWGPTLDDYIFENIPPGENRQTTLGVIIPENAASGTEDNITVTATQENAQISDNASCIAHAAAIGEFMVIIEGKNTAYNLDFTGPPPRVWYENNPPVLAAGRVGLGAVVAGGTVSTCRNIRWNLGEWDVFLDIAFQWMVPGASDVLWYEGYSVFNDTFQCSDLIAALGDLGYSVTGDDTEPITSSLLSPYDILVIPGLQLGNGYIGGDPSLLPDADVDVIVNFVEAGGGLLIMEGTDYFGYCFNRVQNKILRALDFGLIFQNDSVYDDTNNQGAAFEPWCDVDTTTWIGSAYESETGENEIGFYSLSSLAPPPPAGFVSPHSDYGLDTDNDNLYNYLVVEVNVSVDTAGWYRVSGSLYDIEWNWITSDWADNYLEAGTQTLELRFNGWQINSSGRDGPYRVYMYLYDDEWNWLDSDEHETAAYTHDQFQPPPARFAPPHSDYGLDTDNDNLYNYLVVEANVEVDNAEWYRVSSSLYDSEWNWITSAWADNYLDVGAQTLELRFEGLRIYQSERDGPYYVSLDLYDDDGNWLDYDEHETAFYTHDQFQLPPARFAPPHSDYGLDTDNDNLYNYLVVEVNVSVDNAGWYRVYGDLNDSEWNWITGAWADNYLDVGTQTLELRFEGQEIYQSERNGPYYVALDLYDDDWNWLDYDEHETAFYTHDQFQPPPARFTPPHSDYGLDTDNDNLYNYLVIEANVEVDTAGWYEVYGSLRDNEWNWITSEWTDNYLDVGTQTLELRFDGWMIERSGGDGPYHVYLNLYSYEYGWIDSDEHETAFYTHDQFQPPPARFTPPHSDYGLDTDNDNLYNYLVVEVNVSVDTAGWYRVNGDLRDNEGYWITSTQADNYLDVGTQTLGLRFEGLEICRSKRDGPYRVYMSIYDNEYIWLDSDEHETEAYTHDQFQPPPPPVATYIKLTPPYEWTPRVSTTDVANGDDVGTWVNLPFEFPFWGEPKTRVWVCSNGFLIFDPSKSITWTYGSLEDLKERWMIAPFWCDLRTDIAGGIVDDPGIYVDNYADKVVITWEVTRYGDTSDSIKFQVVLYSNGDIRINVDNTTNFWDFYPTLGISRGDGSWYFDITDERETNKSWFFSLRRRGVDVSISPSYQSVLPGETLNYTVTVMNTGNVPDNYALTVSDNLGWGPTLEDDLLEVPAGENRHITLSVTIPEDTAPCTEDNITVTVTSQADITVSDNDSCIAHAIEKVGGWDASITATFSGGSDDAVFGVRPDATPGFDNAYDIPEPPPPVAPSYVRTLFYYPEQTPNELHRSCLAPENLMEWPLRIEYAEGFEDITLTWNIEDVPDDYSVFLYRRENLVADMRAEDNYTFEASTGSYDFRIVVGRFVPFTLELTQGWNMISFPVLPENSSPDAIFDSYYVLYGWDAVNKRYVLHADSGSFIEPDPDVEAGVGYWAYVLENENVNLLGVPVNQLTLGLRLGWNLIGPPYGGSDIADPADDPDNSVIPWAFTWNAREKSYSMTQQLEAGKGYWVYAMQDCELILNVSNVSPTSPYYEVVTSVDWVWDGDTIDVWIENIVVELDPEGGVYEGNSERVRFGGGIDAPEMSSEGGAEAKEFVENLIPLRTTVYLDLNDLSVGGQTGRPYRGEYERLIAVIYTVIDGQWVNINAELLRWGLEEYPDFGWLKYRYFPSEWDPDDWLEEDYPYVRG